MANICVTEFVHDESKHLSVRDSNNLFDSADVLLEANTGGWFNLRSVDVLGLVVVAYLVIDAERQLGVITDLATFLH